MWIHVGDSIKWNVVADEPHTITFLKAKQVRPPFLSYRAYGPRKLMKITLR
jgi:hypothetical protein